EGADGRVDRRIGTKFPDAFAIAHVHGGQASVVAAEEDQTTGGDQRAAAATFVEALLPDNAVGLQIQRRVDATADGAGAHVGTAEELALEGRRLELRGIHARTVAVVGGAD